MDDTSSEAQDARNHEPQRGNSETPSSLVSQPADAPPRISPMAIVILNLLIIIGITASLRFVGLIPLFLSPIAWPILIGIFIIPASSLIKALIRMRPSYNNTLSIQTLTPKPSSKFSTTGFVMTALGGISLLLPYQVLIVDGESGWGGLIAMVLAIPALIIILVGMIMMVHVYFKK